MGKMFDKSKHCSIVKDATPTKTSWSQVQDGLPHALRMRIMTMQQTAALYKMSPPLFITCDNHSSHRT